MWCHCWISTNLPNRSTNDNVSTLLHLVLKHSSVAYARLLFNDFSSAFNSIHTHAQLRKLVQLKANPLLIKWFLILFFFK